MWPSLSEIPLFHVLNAKITFGSVNKCSTEEEANTSAAATPTSTGDNEAAGWKADGLSRIFKHKTHDCHFKLLNYWVFFCFWFFYPPYPAPPPFQVCPSVFEVPASYHRRGGSRHMPVSNNDEELLQYAIHQSLLESRQGTGQVRAIVTDTNFFFMQISPPPSPHAEDCNFPWCLCVCRRGSGIMLMGTSLM